MVEHPERFVPETMGGRLIEAEHVARYHLASGAVVGRDVLDAACGVGYGSAILAGAGARRVVGIDYSADAVADARGRAGHLAEFVLADVCDLPFEDGVFGAIVCLETIEHVQDHDRVLDEFCRVLAADGILIISSPNRGVYPPGNPHHVHELSSAELREALASRLHNVAILRQDTFTASLVGGDAGASNDPAARTALDAELHVVGRPEDLGDPVYLLAAASDAELPRLPGAAVLVEPVEVHALQERVRGAEEACARAWARQAELEAEVHANDQIRGRDTARQLELEQEIVALRRGLYEAEQAGARLLCTREELEQRTTELGRSREELEQSREELRQTRHWLGAVQGSLSWRMTVPLRWLMRRWRKALGIRDRGLQP